MSLIAARFLLGIGEGAAFPDRHARSVELDAARTAAALRRASPMPSRASAMRDAAADRYAHCCAYTWRGSFYHRRRI